jgi:hypothetical protein
MRIMNDAAQQRACRAIGIIVRRMLAGQVSFLDGARALLRLRIEAGLACKPRDAVQLGSPEAARLPGLATSPSSASA